MVANRMDPDQTAPAGAVWFGSSLFVKKLLKHFSRRQKQIAFVVIDVLLTLQSTTGPGDVDFGTYHICADTYILSLKL